ncbi:MAG: helix-turn-helix transcriptional regulator [Oscillospiraceae bacterium]|nr:helix-turn-helix transcriptional regulator [Oscillospiraceae bacterium]
MKHYRNNRMQELRENLNLTQIEVAQILSIGKSTYCDYEKACREPSYEILIKIADLFQVPLDYLLKRELPESNCISLKEWEMLKKYKALSSKKQELINLILDFEFQDSQNCEQTNSETQIKQNLFLVKKASRDGDSVREELISEEELREIENLKPMKDI